ncbi:hypothetical protein [Streptomyces sp. NPDC047061]
MGTVQGAGPRDEESDVGDWLIGQEPAQCGIAPMFPATDSER